MKQFLAIAELLLLTSTLASEFPPKFELDSSSEFPPGHLKEFGYHRPPEGPVSEESGVLHPKTFWEKYVSIHRPMVFRQATASSPAVVKWTDEYLASTHGDLDVLLEVKKEKRVAPPQRTNMTSFINRYKNEDIYAVSILPDPMREEVQVPSCLLCGTFRNFMHETNFWMSSGGTRSVIHYDADENLHCIVNGSKDFMMINSSFKKFLPMFRKKQFTGSGFSRMDPDFVDLLRYPEVAKVEWTYATLYPGDCIYIPSEYLHQVRSHKRTISATMLFTTELDKSFRDTNCEKTTFDYTPLSAIDVHWTYKKGDRYIDMGYINLEFLRKNLIDILRTVEKDNFSLSEFQHFYKFATQAEDDDMDEQDLREAEEVFTKVFQVERDGIVTEENIRELPRENLKILARNIDAPHGPVAGDESTDNDDRDDDEEFEDIFHDKQEL